MLTLLGLHCIEARASAGNSDSEAVWELLPSLAVITAVLVLLTVPATALNTALVAPLSTVTDGGIVSAALLVLSVTVALEAAVSFSVTVQVL